MILKTILMFEMWWSIDGQYYLSLVSGSIGQIMPEQEVNESSKKIPLIKFNLKPMIIYSVELLTIVLWCLYVVQYVVRIFANGKWKSPIALDEPFSQLISFTGVCCCFFLLFIIHLHRPCWKGSASEKKGKMKFFRSNNLTLNCYLHQKQIKIDWFSNEMFHRKIIAGSVLSATQQNLSKMMNVFIYSAEQYHGFFLSVSLAAIRCSILLSHIAYDSSPKFMAIPSQ